MTRKGFRVITQGRICSEMEQHYFQASFKIATSAQQTRTRPTEVIRLLL